MKFRNCFYTFTVSAAVLIFISGYRFNNNDTVTDYDGNVYHTVTIGTQIWMVENLKTTHYRNGNAILHAADDKQWFNACAGNPGALTDAYCNYDNDAKNVTVYGQLYNSQAVIDSRNICPAGWHIPTSSE